MPSTKAWQSFRGTFDRLMISGRELSRPWIGVSRARFIVEESETVVGWVKIFVASLRRRRKQADVAVQALDFEDSLIPRQQQVDAGLEVCRGHDQRVGHAERPVSGAKR